MCRPPYCQHTKKTTKKGGTREVGCGYVEGRVRVRRRGADGDCGLVFGRGVGRGGEALSPPLLALAKDSRLGKISAECLAEWREWEDERMIMVGDGAKWLDACFPQ
jgi:hypothetical protein